MTHRHHRAACELRIDERGAVKKVSMIRWGNPEGEFAAYPFGGYVDEERTFFRLHHSLATTGGLVSGVGPIHLRGGVLPMHDPGCDLPMIRARADGPPLSRKATRPPNVLGLIKSIPHRRVGLLRRLHRRHPVLRTTG